MFSGRFRNLVIWSCSIAAFTTGSVKAESVSAVLRDFGLIGSWSADCAKSVTDPCIEVRGGLACPLRIIYAAPQVGLPTRTTVMGTVKGGSTIEATSEIISASRVTEQRLEFAYVMNGQPDIVKEFPWSPQNGETWQVVLVKDGAKYRLLETRRSDGRKFQVKGGFLYRHRDAPDSSIDAEWVNTQKQPPLFEKCLN